MVPASAQAGGQGAREGVALQPGLAHAGVGANVGRHAARQRVVRHHELLQRLQAAQRLRQRALPVFQQPQAKAVSMLQ